MHAESERSGLAPDALLRAALLIIVATALALAAEHWFAGRGDEGVGTAMLVSRPAYGPATYRQALADSDARVAAKEDLERRFPGDWMRREAVGFALIDRFRLTGDYADLARARAVIAAARSTVAPPAGPILADAEIAMAGHRLTDAETALAAFAPAVAPERVETVAAAALAGDIAFYRGDLESARTQYDAAGPIGMRDRLVLIAKAQGRFDEALTEQRMAAADRRRPSPFALATLSLRAGMIELARGDKAAARAFFERADEQFSGYWLTEAHLAQADALDGRAGQALKRMEKVAKTSKSAEVMDALALLLRTEGRVAESRLWAARASEAWQRRLALAPEAAWGHAVEHELVFGTPERALDLARRNLANRPFGEARVLMANALLVNGRTAEALGQLRAAENSGWRSAPMYALRAILLEIAGEARAAETARRQAQALNPAVFEPWTALIWFSHG